MKKTTDSLVDSQVKIIIDVIRTGNAFMGCKFAREKALMKKVADATYSIYSLNLAGVKCLEKSGIKSVGKIIAKSDAEILAIKNIGKKKSEDIISTLDPIRRQILADIVAEKITKENVAQISNKGKAPSIFDVISKLTNSNQKDILVARFGGMTLQEIADTLELTRQRVHQQQENGLEAARKILKEEYGKKQFAEDAYSTFFKMYDTGEDFWSCVSENGKWIFGYLNTVYGYGKSPMKLQEALFDDDVTEELKNAIRKHLNGKALVVDGAVVDLSRRGIEDYLLGNRCQRPTTVSEFMSMYNEFLAVNGIETDSDLALDSSERNCAARIQNSEDVLWLGSNTFRFYDFSKRDFNSLVEALPLNEYCDTEISAKVFTRDFPDIMDKYDIHNENELHYILKKVICKNEFPNVRFGRTPMIKFGSSDRELNVFRLMMEMSPVDKEDLVRALVERYGVNRDTVVANWLNGISKYNKGGKYVFDASAYPFLYRKDAA